MNQAINAVATMVVSINNNPNGSLSTGNVFINGHMGANTFAVAASIHGGNVQSSANLVVTSNVAVGNSTTNVFIGYGTLDVTGTINVGANVGLTTVHAKFGNSTVNATLNSVGLALSGNLSLNAESFGIGNSTVNVFVNSSSFNLNGSPLVTNATAAKVQNSGTLIGSQAITNFINGSGISLTISEDAPGNRINVIIAATGAGSVNATDIGCETISIGNSTVNSFINSTFSNLNIGLYRTSVNVGANVHLNTSSILVGNSTVSVFTNSVLVQVSNSTQSANLTVSGVLVGQTTINATHAYVGNSTVFSSVNCSTINTATGNFTTLAFVGNSTVNVSINSSSVTVGANARLNEISLFLGNSTVNTVINSSVATVNTLAYVQGVQQTSFANTTSGTSQQVVDFYPITNRTAKYVVSVKDENANAYTASEIVLLFDGTNTLLTEYAMLQSNGIIGSFAAGANSTHVLLQYTPVSTSMTLKGLRTLIPV
jgi:fibronectin-binding autotransporter adhesin